MVLKKFLEQLEIFGKFIRKENIYENLFEERNIQVWKEHLTLRIWKVQYIYNH
jgi:hypothetical protein